MLRISSKKEKVPYSPIRKLMPLAKKAKKRGTIVYHLNIGQPDLKTHPAVFDFWKNYQPSILKYSPSQGEEELISAIRAYYKRREIDLDEEDILVTSGGSEAIIFAFLGIAEPGEEFLVPEPVYANYLGFAAITGVKLIPLTTYAENGFHLPQREKIEAKINLKTRGIIICNPSNPTGTVYTPEEMGMLVDIAYKNKLFLISDEVYSDFVFDNKKYTYLFSFLKTRPEVKENLIVIDSVSKKFSACGARVGALITKNKVLLDLILKFAQARLSVPVMEQLAMAQAYRESEDYLRKSREEYQRRRDVVWEILKDRDDIVVDKPEGAFYCVLSLKIRDAEVFARWLLEDFSYENETVMVAPAKGFYISPGMGNNEIRIAYILESEKIRRAMEVFLKAYDQYKRIENILISGSKVIS